MASTAHSLTATATDAAGNQAGASGPLAVTVDIKVPAAPAALNLADADDTAGESSSDNLTNLALGLTFDGTTTAEAGLVVQLHSDKDSDLGDPVDASTGSATVALGGGGAGDGDATVITATGHRRGRQQHHLGGACGDGGHRRAGRPGRAEPGGRRRHGQQQQRQPHQPGQRLSFDGTGGGTKVVLSRRASTGLLSSGTLTAAHRCWSGT